jgi:hypothetical protein
MYAMTHAISTATSGQDPSAETRIDEEECYRLSAAGKTLTVV